MDNLLVQLIIGGLVGWLASILMHANRQMGILANVVIGIIGSILGHVLADAAGLLHRNVAAGWIVSILGAALLIWILRAFGVFNRKAWR
jgi:uncharacterized membrane protein YeaQ/YmgE (transglycosylase-associated protein family)